MPDSVKIGVVGAARILPAHLRGLQLLKEHGFDNWRITAIASRRIDDALMFRKRGEGPPPRPSVITYEVDDPLNAPHMYVSDLHDDVLPDLYADWREMLEKADVDAVLVLATVDLHHQIALEALRAGKHVLVEKPMAITVRAGRMMVEEASRRRLQLGVAEVLRYFEFVRLERWVVESGQIGNVQMWISGGMGAPDWSPDLIVGKTPWRQKKLLAGGGPAIDFGVHLFDQILYVGGEIDEISALAPQLERTRVTRDESGRVVESVENEVEDAYLVLMRFRSGAVGQIFGGVAGHGEPMAISPSPIIYGTKGVLKGTEVVLDGGRRADAGALFRQEAGPELVERWFPGGIRGDLREPFALQLLDFLRAVETGKPMETDGAEGLRALACSFAVLESSAANRPIRVKDVLTGKVDRYQREIDEHYRLSLGTRAGRKLQGAA
jgi:1,5-anhydro-D-fructose reductase (1,5-anhydro-D-mannitol-forming)